MDVIRAFQETQSSAPRGVTGSATAPQGRCRALLLPQKRRIRGQGHDSGAIEDLADSESTLTGDTTEIILALCGDAGKDVPATVTYDDAEYRRMEKSTVSRKMRSAMWGFVQLYELSSAREQHKVALCCLCHGLGKHVLIILQTGNNSNGNKHLEYHADNDVPTVKQLAHARVTLYILRKVRGGTRGRQLGEDNKITKYVKHDQRAHHLSCVRMQMMFMSPHFISSNAFMRSFLAQLSIFTPPVPDTVTHHLLELHMYLLSLVRRKIAHVKTEFRGMAFCHKVCDMWTEKHRSNAFRSVVVRCVDPISIQMGVVNLGVSLFVGRHDNANIRCWLPRLLASSGLSKADISSKMTDSGANVRRAMHSLQAVWLPCFSHSLHNAVHFSLGWTGDAGTTVLGRMQKLLGHFNHSERSVELYNRVPVPFPDPQSGPLPRRSLLRDIITRWSSTYRAIARPYTCHDRLAVFFASLDVGVVPRRRELSPDDCDRLRQVLGVLRNSFEVTTRTESAFDPVCGLVSLLRSLRQALYAPCFRMPVPPRTAMAVGSDAIRKYCAAHSEQLVVEVNNYLYATDDRYVKPTPGKKAMCEEAATVVAVLRTQVDPRFFNSDEASRNILDCPAVLASSMVTPGGPRLFREVARLVGQSDPVLMATLIVHDLCAKFVSSSLRALTARQAQTPSPRHRERSCLVDLCADDDDGAGADATPTATAAQEELVVFLKSPNIPRPIFLRNVTPSSTGAHFRPSVPR